MAEEVSVIPQDDSKPTRLSVTDFATKIKTKYPDYSHVGDDELVKKILTKYPDYAEQVDLSTPKKKVSTEVSQPTSTNSFNGGGIDPVSLVNQSNATAPLAPVVDQGLRSDIQAQDDAIRQQKLQQQEQLSNNLKKIRTAMPESDRANIDKAINIVASKTPDALTAPTEKEKEHTAIMDMLDNTWQGKLIKSVGYLGSKATKGTLQIAKGVSHLVELADDPMKFATGQESATDGFFKKADELANYGLTKSDVSNIEDGTGMGKHALAGIGMMAEFAPSIALGEATAAPKAVFYLQGLGQGKDLSDSLKKQGKDLNPLAKEALIQGSGFVNMILSDLGDNLYGKLPSVARGKIATGIVADAIKESAGKDLTYDGFKTLLDKGAKTFADKFEKAPLEILNKYNHTAATLGGLNVANFAVHKGVDKINDTPVFNETAGDLAGGLVKTVTQDAPMFTALGAVPEMTKLTPYSNYKNDVVESIMHNPSKENIDAIKSQIANHGSEQGWSQGEMAGSLQHIEQIGAATRKLPNTLTPDKKGDAVGLIIDRDGLTKKLQQVQEGKQELDPSIKDIPTAQEQYLTDKIEQANDKLRSIVTGKKVTYSKDETNPEKPKFFKTIDSKQEEITPERYDLEKTERELKTTTNEQPLQPENDKVNTELLPEQQKETSAIVPDETVKPVVDPTRQHAIDAITNGVLIPENGKTGETSARFDFGMTTVEKQKGVADITKGNYETAPAKKLIEKVMEMEANDAYPIIEGTGGATIRNRAATSAEIKQHLEDAKSSKIGELTKQQIEEINKPLQDLGFTHQDFIDYENSRNEQRGTGRPSEASDGRTVESIAEPIQQSANDQTTSKPQNTGGEATQGKSGEEVKAGDPLRTFAAKVREGKISKLGGFKSGSLFDVAWDGSLEVVATTLDAGAKLADAIEAGLKHIRQSEFYKGLQDKSDFEQQYRSHWEKEYAVGAENNAKAKEKVETGSRHESTAQTREDFGFGEYERISKKEAELSKEADDALASGYNINELITKMDRGTLPTDVEQVIVRKYISSLEKSIDESPTPENISKLKQAIEVSDRVGGTELARSLAARRGTVVKEDNLANFLMDEMNAMGADELPSEQITNLKKSFTKGQEAKTKYEQSVAGKQGKEKDLVAKAEIDNIRKSIPSKSRKSHEEFVAERKEAIKKMRADLIKVARGGFGANSSIPLAPQLQAIAPHVRTLLRSYVEEGVVNLKDVVKNLHDELKDVIDGVTEENVRDLIAGEYNEKKSTKNEISSQIVELTQQAKLVKRLEDIESGKEPKSVSKKSEQTAEIKELRDKIKEAEDKAGITEERSLRAKQTYLKNQIEKLKEDLANGNFDREPEQPKKLVLDSETQKYQDEYIEFLKETNMRRDKARYERLSKTEKTWDRVQQVLGLKRFIQTSIDLSMPLRQAVTVTLNPRHLAVTKKSFAKMFSTVFNGKNYDRVMFEMEQQPIYKEMMADKLQLSTVGAHDNLNREEDHRTSFIYKIPYLREPLIASERAATAYINTARFELYSKMKMNFEAQGITRSNSPETYKEMSKWVMNVTGRGNLLKFIEESPQGQRILGNTFYGARLMASRFNLLNPVYYKRMPKAVRIEAIKDMAAFSSTLLVTGLALQASGVKISLDPDDPDFLKAVKGSVHVDLTGGLAQYIRTFLRLVKAVEYRVDPTVTKSKANKYGAKTAKSVVSFFRYKLAPNTSYVVNAVTGTNPLGGDFDPYEIIRIYPMYAEDLKEGYKQGGLTTALTVGALSTFGAGVQVYKKK